MNIDSERISKLLRIINDYNNSEPKPYHPITTNIDFDGLIVQCWMRDLPIDGLAYGEPYDSILKGWSQDAIVYVDENNGLSVIGGRDEHGCDIEYDIYKNKLYISLRYWRELRSAIINYDFANGMRTYANFWERLDSVLKPLGKRKITCKSDFVRIISKCNKLETVYTVYETMNYFLIIGFYFPPTHVECIIQDYQKGIDIIKRLYANYSALSIQKAWKHYWLEPYYDSEYGYEVSRYMINKSSLLGC